MLQIVSALIVALGAYLGIRWAERFRITQSRRAKALGIICNRFSRVLQDLKTINLSFEEVRKTFEDFEGYYRENRFYIPRSALLPLDRFCKAFTDEVWRAELDATTTTTMRQRVKLSELGCRIQHDIDKSFRSVFGIWDIYDRVWRCRGIRKKYRDMLNK